MLAGIGSMLSFYPTDAGLLRSTCAPELAGSGYLPTTGFIFLVRVNMPETITVANLLVWVSTVGATLTSNQNFGAIYDTNGNLIAYTADQSSAWTSTGLKTMALTANTGHSLTLSGNPGNFYWLALLTNGTTGPTFACVQSKLTTQPGHGYPYATTIPGATHRSGYISGGGRTGLPSLNGATVTDSTMFSLIWMGLT